MMIVLPAVLVMFLMAIVKVELVVILIMKEK